MAGGGEGGRGGLQRLRSRQNHALRPARRPGQRRRQRRGDEAHMGLAELHAQQVPRVVAGVAGIDMALEGAHRPSLPPGAADPPDGRFARGPFQPISGAERRRLGVAQQNKTERSHLGTLFSLAPWLWPKGEPELRLRVVVAVALLVAAKAANVLVPLAYAKAVDALVPKAGAAAAVLAVPVALVVGYGLLRIASSTFAELRNAVFSKVLARAARRIGLSVFAHLHALSMRYHMDRQTGGLSRVIERGTRGITLLLNFLLFNIIPTIVEIFLVAGILWALFDLSFAAVTLITIGGYIAFTLAFTNWRLRFRREMNRTDQDANTKAIDSLLNYETVKYFGNEAHEARRYDESLTRYERAYVRSESTLNMLNAGQATIIAAGLTLVMLLAARGVVAGTMTAGDFVLVNTYLIQLYMPLNILGFAYREIKQG